MFRNTAYLAIRVAALAALCAVAGGAGASAACDTDMGHSARVAQVIDAHTLRLDDGSQVRLIGALPPQPPFWWKGKKEWPPAAKARRVLEQLVHDARAELRFAGDEPKRDRHQRWLAQVYIVRGDERIWVQAHMVREGYALAWSLTRHRACIRDLQRHEDTARGHRAGLWRSGEYTVLPAVGVEALSKRRGSYQLVEARIASVGNTGKWTFLNTSDDWRSDFTVAIAAGNRRAFKGSDAGLDMLEGRKIRVRGWIERWNGPVVKATHPGQIEILAD